MPFYVALCHIRHDARGGSAATYVMNQLKTNVNSGGGLVRRVNNSGVRPLPTRMKAKSGGKRYRYAHIASMEFAANPQCAIEATTRIRNMDDVLRLTLLRADDLLLARPPRPRGEPADGKEVPQEMFSEIYAHELASRADKQPLTKGNSTFAEETSPGTGLEQEPVDEKTQALIEAMQADPRFPSQQDPSG